MKPLPQLIPLGSSQTDPKVSGIWLLATYYLAAAILMWMLKRHYSTADAEQIRWMLQPVSGLVAWLSGSDYIWETGIGYVRADQRFTIAPACAGINFMIMTFGLTVAAFLHCGRHNIGRIVMLAGALSGAYLLSLAANASRIVLAIALYEHEVTWGWLTPERLHRLAGVVVYFGALSLYYTLLKRIISRKSALFRLSPVVSSLLPWLWYAAGAVAVPMVNRLYRGSRQPASEHLLTVIGASAVLWGLGFVAVSLLKASRRDSILSRRHRINENGKIDATENPNRRR